MKRWIVVAAVGCGRVNFDPVGAGGDDMTDGDGGIILGDGSVTTGDASLVAGGADCASATTLSFGTSGTGSLAGATNDVPPFFCADGVEIVYRVPVTAAANHRLYVRPINFTVTVTIAPQCPPTGGSCTERMSPNVYDATSNFAAPERYIIIDKTAGTGTTFDLTLE